MSKARCAEVARPLAEPPDIGAAMVVDLLGLGTQSPGQLTGWDPYHPYDRHCQVTGVLDDPRVLDTLIRAVRVVEGAPPRHCQH